MRKPSVASGDKNVSDAFVVANEWDSYPSNTFSFLGSHSFDGTVVDPGPDPEPEVPSLIGSVVTVLSLSVQFKVTAMLLLW